MNHIVQIQLQFRSDPFLSKTFVMIFDSRVAVLVQKRDAMQRRTSLGLYPSAQFDVIIGELISVS